ncbi:MAG TPA: alpha/beta fold hydrolase [Rhodocyclaceae bacterium]|nr:alpha/beta fold hydrolase [Rhodocyclaceae bacterium]
MENLEILCADGRALAGRLFTHQGSTRRGVLVINSATGVAQRYYQPFAEYFAAAGFAVITWDARGIGQSRHAHPRHESARMRDWGRHDLDAVLRHSVDTLGADWSEVSVIGHSSGGHLSPLAPALQQVPRLLLIASGTGNWRKYPKGQWPRLLGAWHAAMPLLLATFGYVPGWLGIGHDLPRGVAEDWRRWCLNADYLFSDATLDSSGYARYAGKVRADLERAARCWHSPSPTTTAMPRPPWWMICWHIFHWPSASIARSTRRRSGGGRSATLPTSGQPTRICGKWWKSGCVRLDSGLIISR